MTHETTYVLTVCDDKIFDDVFNMGQLLLLLERKDMPCTRLISTTNSDILASYNNKPIMLKAYIEGEVHDNLNETMLFQLGSQAARLDQTTEGALRQHANYVLLRQLCLLKSFEESLLPQLLQNNHKLVILLG